MAQIPALTPLRKQMATVANNVIDTISTTYDCNWSTADSTGSYYAAPSTITYPYSNVGVVSSLTPPTLSVISETEIDKKINDALGKLDEHVDQLEGDIEFFNEERQKQEQKTCHLEDENKILKDECQALRDEVEELGNKITTLRNDLNTKEIRLEAQIERLESIIEELQSLKEKVK